MKLLFDFLPVLIFFLTFKLYGIYAATVFAILASFLQVSIHWLKYKQFEKMHVITFVLILTLGGATLFFHDPLFIKWKPTGIYWISAIIFLGSQFVGNKTIVQKMMENNITLPTFIWSRLNFAWAVFFVLMGTLNIYIAYNYETNTWVNFKFFGGLGLTVVFVVIQSVYLAKYIDNNHSISNQNG